MKKMIDNMKKLTKKVVDYYVDCMRLYGEALLRGGSYGCV
jgi:hypothetical protein